MRAQAAEVRGDAAVVVDKEDRAQRQTQLADSQLGFEFKVEDRKIHLQYQNMAACTVNYYLMDIELLFSRKPFVQEVGGQFSVIQPNHTETLKLVAKKQAHVFDLPKQYRDQNVMIEIRSGGLTKNQAYYPHSLGVQVLQQYGQLRITHEKTGKALPKTYVKVYARMDNGLVKFYKDGYTDLRGRFDYTSLNTNELEDVDRFSILIMSDEHGAVIREAKKPQQ